MSSKNLGPGVSGYLNPDERAWETAVFQAGKPVLDKELNLQQDIDGGAGQLALRQGMPTGWLSASFLASSVPDVGASSTANSYDFERMVAHVNGWIIPVQNTGMNDTTNTLDLGEGPIGTGTKRTDIVILEVWRMLLAPAPSAVGKSPSGRIWQNGNVKIAPADDLALNPADDILDATLGAESTKRVQIQYRLRVVHGVDVFAYPYGIDDPTTVAHSIPTDAATPDGVFTAFTYVNQSAAGDPGLWRAGDGIPTNTLGTVDGYMYAVPLAAVFRRNRTAFDRNSNQNGGVATPGPSDRPDGLFFDIVTTRDVVDLRLGVSPVGWDYSEILAKNLGFLLDNALATEWTNALDGGGYNGATVFVADEIGISNANGGDGVTTGDTPAGVLIDQFDATRRFFSDRAIYETVIVKIDAPGGGWVSGSVVTIQPTALEIPPYAPFNWAAYAPSDVLFVDIGESWWIGTGAGKKTRTLSLGTVTGLATNPITALTLTIGDLTGFGLTDEPLYVTLTVAYPRGLGLTRTPTEVFTDSISINNPAQLPAAAPVSYSALALTNGFDFPHREVQLQYTTVSVTTTFDADTSAGTHSTFFLPDRVDSIVSILKNGVAIIGGFSVSFNGRTVALVNPADFTVDGDTLTVTYSALRPLPQNDEQLTFYYAAKAPQALRSSNLGLGITVIPRYVGSDVYALTVGSGSEDEAYPFPYAYVQMGGIYPSSVGTFNGDHELSASAAVSVTNYSADNGFLKLAAFLGYTPAPEEVSFIRGPGDTDIEGRSYFKEVPGGVYIPNAFAQQLSDAKHHRNVVPMIAELFADSPIGFKGQLVLVLLIREAVFDANNGVSFEPLASNTTTAAVFHLKGHLLNRGI